MLMIIMTMLCYKNGNLMMTAAYYKSSKNDKKFNNNEGNICLLPIR